MGHHQPLHPAPETSLQGFPWMYSPVLTKFSPIPINTQHPNPTLAQHQGTESHQGSFQLEAATSQLILPSSGFCGKSKSTASLGTPSPAFVTAQVTPTTAFMQGRMDPRGARTSRTSSLSQEPSHSPGDTQAPGERGPVLP